MTDDDRRLREAFQVHRAGERTHAPSFRSVLEGRRATGRRTFAFPALGMVATVALVILTVSIRAARTHRAELEMARQVMGWRSPTAFLFPDPAPGLVSSIRRIDEAPEGSPLTALDHGGQLGPPILPRSSPL